MSQWHFATCRLNRGHSRRLIDRALKRGYRLAYHASESDLAVFSDVQLFSLGACYVEPYLVSVADCGADAITLAGTCVPDVALIDIILPGGLDGFEVARLFRALFAPKVCRLVAVSGYATAYIRAKGAEAGFQGFLQKPYTSAELDAAMNGADVLPPRNTLWGFRHAQSECRS